MSVLEKKVVLVTGASRGVGRGIAIGLAHAGATVYATGRSIDQAKLDTSITSIRATTRTTTPCAVSSTVSALSSRDSMSS